MGKISSERTEKRGIIVIVQTKSNSIIRSQIDKRRKIGFRISYRRRTIRKDTNRRSQEKKGNIVAGTDSQIEKIEHNKRG